MNERWRKAAVASLTTSAALVGMVSGCGTDNTFSPPPPPEVVVSPAVVRTNFINYFEQTGTTRAFSQVDLRARVTGFLKEVRFREGDVVKANDVLLVIDEAPFKAVFDQAQAKVDEARASLKKAEESKGREVAKAQIDVDLAALSLADVEERRNRSLLARNAGSREDVDKSEASRKRSAAQVEADKASYDQSKADFDINILAAKASLESALANQETAKIDLGYCRITSPISGHITRRSVDVGNLVGDGTATVLATVVQDDPLYAYISVSDTDVLQFRALVRAGKRVDYRKETIPMELGMTNEKGYPHKGRFDYADPGADPGTGTVQVRGLFSNPDRMILPGLFVRLRVPGEVKSRALLVPEQAVGTDQTGRFLMVVGTGDKVEKRVIKVGTRSDDGLLVIEEGLKPDELVVVNGLQRARPGLTVKPLREEIKVAPSAASAQTPAGDSAAAKPESPAAPPASNGAGATVKPKG